MATCLEAATVMDQEEIRLKAPAGLSPRLRHLRDWYHRGVQRGWRNPYTAWTTGTAWDVVFEEMTYHIVPEMFVFLDAYGAGYHQAARPVPLPAGFWQQSLAERRAWFVREVMARHLPQEVLPGSLLAGSRFSLMASRCFDRREWRQHRRGLAGRNGARAQAVWFFRHGYGNVGSTSGHLIPDYPAILHRGFRGIHADLEQRLADLTPAARRGPQGAQVRAMLTAAAMPREVAGVCATACRTLAGRESDPERVRELATMAANLDRVPWEPPQDFWQAVQAVWLAHMLAIADENYIGGISFGRIDQYLFPFWQRSLAAGMDREFGKELLRCLWIHANLAYDAMITIGGRQGMVAGYGQLMTLSGLRADGSDGTNDLTHAFLEVAQDMDPLLQPKLNVRLHRQSPEALLDHLVAMMADYQGSPCILNFDERSMAGLLREGRRAGYADRITPATVLDYSPLGCLENTLCGNDRSGTADIHLNLCKPVELALNDGFDLITVADPMSGRVDRRRRHGAATGRPEHLSTWGDFQQAVVRQVAACIRTAVSIYGLTDALRARFCPTPYLSCLVRGCAEKGIDVAGMGAEINFATLEGTAFASAVDSLLAIRHLVYQTGACSLSHLRQAVIDDWVGHEVLLAMARGKAPKYGRDDADADGVARWFMEVWTEEVWRHRVGTTGRPLRPGMLAWNTMVGDAMVAPAGADGRRRGQFFSNALCPSNGADREGPTANIHSAGTVLGGRCDPDPGDHAGYVNLLPNGASHTISFNPSCLASPEQRQRFKAVIRGYAENGGTALQINLIDRATLERAQEQPDAYAHLMVRITGYNAYFTHIGRELQNEVIARMVHGGKGG